MPLLFLIAPLALFGTPLPQPPPSVPAETGRQSPPVPTTPDPPQGQNTPGQIDVSATGDFRSDEATGDFVATENVTIKYADLVITADRAEGNFNREVLLTGNPKVTRGGLNAYADAIHFYPKTRTYRLDNPRASLDPSIFKNRILDPVTLRGGELQGSRNGYTYSENSRATTCIELHPHYELRYRSAELIPDRRLVLKKVAVYFFGQRLIVLPELVIPLDSRQRRLRADYLPEFGRNTQEGFFARFPYAFAIGSAAATFIRLDATQKQGPGYRVEQEYLAGKQDRNLGNSNDSTDRQPRFDFTGASGSYVQAYGYGNLRGLPRLGTGIGPTNGGLFTVQGYVADGFERNLNASFRHQQGIGGNNRFALSSEYQKNALFSFSNQTTLTSRFNFDHQDSAHGGRSSLVLNMTRNDGDTFRTRLYTGQFRQGFDWATQGSNRNSFSLDLDFARSLTTSAFSSTRAETLNTQVQFDHVSRDYSFSLAGNKLSPIGAQTTAGSFGSLERLPELQFATDTTTFRSGWLKSFPTQFNFGYGYYSEPGSNTQTSRYLLGLTLPERSILKGRSTEIATGGGFEQRLYGDTAAQYIVKNTSRLRQQFGGRSGMDFTYQYQEPAGGTPFLFDTFGRSHYITAEAGYLNDSRFQVTGRVGYDFLGTSSTRPWQTVSSRLMWRPSNATRMDMLATFDPNTSKFFAVTGSLKLRGPHDMAFDLLSRYDAQVGRFAQVNGQFEFPFLGKWRATGLVRYNGYNGRFESTNLQLAYRWDCMEASVTYSSSPYGFQAQQQFYFALRLTSIPFFRAFNRGSAGDPAGTSIGDLY